MMSYYAACFCCPGQSTESVRQTALVSNGAEQKILANLNMVVGLKR